MKNEILLKLNTPLIALKEIWSYMPDSFITSKWDGTYYTKIGKNNRTEQRPTYLHSSFELNLKKDNPLKLNRDSSGIYVIYDEVSCIYVGKTDKKIIQRFNAHISKITAVNKHNHPNKWQEYARLRYKNRFKDFRKLDEFKMGFYELEKFKDYLNGTSKDELVSEMEALIFFGLKNKNNNNNFLNTLSSISTSENREKWQNFFNLI